MSNTQRSVLGKAPSGWTVAELQDLGSWGGGKTPRKSNQEYWNGETPWVSPKDMGGSVVRRTEDHVSQVALSEKNLTVYEAGAVMVVFRSGVLRHTFPVATCNRPFTVNQDMKVLTPASGVDNRFAFHLIDHLGPVVLQKATKVGTTVESVDTDSFMSLSVGLPTLSEQRRIADVLDTVDAAIQDTESVVEKQEQVKTGLHQDLLTRGLDADGRLRNPEREPEAFRETDLGDLPEDWEINTLETVASSPEEVIIGPFGSNLKASDYREQGVPVVFVRDVVRSQGFEWNSEIYLEPQKAEELSSHSVRPGDVVATKMGDPPGEAVVYPDWMPEGIITADIIRIRPGESVLPEWLAAFINGWPVRSQVRGIMGGVTRAKVTVRDFRKIRVAVPPMSEQQRIVSRMSEGAHVIDEEKSYCRKLNQLKMGLVQDLLTGQVRVPEAEARVDEVVA
jgi:type I restriction enzyme S subunit